MLRFLLECSFLLFFLLWWNAVRDPGVWGTIWNESELTWKVILQYLNISELIHVTSRDVIFSALFAVCQSSLWLLCTQVSSSGKALGCFVVSDANWFPHHGQNSAWAVCCLQLLQFCPCVCWRLGDREIELCSLWSLDLLVHILGPCPLTKSNFCSNILAQVPQELALINSVVAWILSVVPSTSSFRWANLKIALNLKVYSRAHYKKYYCY